MGTLWIVSSGPGNAAQLTPAATQAVKSADIVIGNAFYVELLGDIVERK